MFYGQWLSLRHLCVAFCIFDYHCMGYDIVLNYYFSQMTIFGPKISNRKHAFFGAGGAHVHAKLDAYFMCSPQKYITIEQENKRWRYRIAAGTSFANGQIHILIWSFVFARTWKNISPSLAV